ncbi:MAG TPA: ATP-binding protein [Candidatus Binatia bacterium]|jgi:signal transduction histidine kinase|nr:ATP-binding protein [Candidatus Binatia bacterium]
MRSLISFLTRVFFGLRFRLLVLVVLTCAPLIALMLRTAGEDRRRAMTSWGQRAQRVQQIARREEQEVIGATRQLLLAVAESASVTSLNPKRCKKFLEDEFGSYGRYANLGVVTTNGEVLASAVPIFEQTNQADRHFFRRALETRAFSIGEFPVRKPLHEPPTISFGYPVLDAGGGVLAVVFAELNLNWLDRSGDISIQLPKAAIWFEIDRNGIILARNPKPELWIGRPFSEPSLVSAAFVRTNEIVEAPGQGGVATFYAFGSVPSDLASGEVASILSIPRAILFADADRMLRRNLTWLGLAAGLALFLGWLGSKFLILRPVRAVVDSIARLAAGDLSARTRLPSSGDELGRLIQAFDKMAQALEQRERERLRASQKLQVLSHRLVEVQETERRHIARELHDEIGQSLTAAELNLQAALQDRGSADLERRLEDSIKAVERVLEQVHDLSLNLRPSMLDDLGLEPALRWYTQRQAALTGMRSDFSAEPLPHRLDPIIETECFRIGQEALTNVVRHAQARAVVVHLSRQNGHLHLSVRDDGIGFDVEAFRGEAVRGASLGLLSMQERAALAGGGLEFNSAPGRGTEVHAWFPLKWQGASSTLEIHE